MCKRYSRPLKIEACHKRSTEFFQLHKRKVINVNECKNIQNENVAFITWQNLLISPPHDWQTLILTYLYLPVFTWSIFYLSVFLKWNLEDFHLSFLTGSGTTWAINIISFAAPVSYIFPIITNGVWDITIFWKTICCFSEK